MGKGKGERKTRDFRSVVGFAARKPARSAERRQESLGGQSTQARAAGKSDSGERARTQSASALRAGDGDRGAQ